VGPGEYVSAPAVISWEHTFDVRNSRRR